MTAHTPPDHALAGRTRSYLAQACLAAPNLRCLPHPQTPHAMLEASVCPCQAAPNQARPCQAQIDRAKVSIDTGKHRTRCNPLLTAHTETCLAATCHAATRQALPNEAIRFGKRTGCAYRCLQPLPSRALPIPTASCPAEPRLMVSPPEGALLPKRYRLFTALAKPCHAIASLAPPPLTMPRLMVSPPHSRLSQSGYRLFTALALPRPA